MPARSFTFKGTNDTLTIETDSKGMFLKATLNGKPMNEKVPENVKNAPIDMKEIESAVANFSAPTAAKPQGAPKAAPASARAYYAYCIPIKDSQGHIIRWICGGTGTVTC